jgi:hypothetical protein
VSKVASEQKPALFGVDEALLGVALVLLTAGLWALVHVAALIAPGLVLLWVALPPRHAFVARPPEPLSSGKGRS